MFVPFLGYLSVFRGNIWDLSPKISEQDFPLCRLASALVPSSSPCMVNKSSSSPREFFISTFPGATASLAVNHPFPVVCPRRVLRLQWKLVFWSSAWVSFWRSHRLRDAGTTSQKTTKPIKPKPTIFCFFIPLHLWSRSFQKAIFGGVNFSKWETHFKQGLNFSRSLLIPQNRQYLKKAPRKWNLVNYGGKFEDSKSPGP